MWYTHKKSIETFGRGRKLFTGIRLIFFLSICLYWRDSMVLKAGGGGWRREDLRQRLNLLVNELLPIASLALLPRPRI